MCNLSYILIIPTAMGIPGKHQTNESIGVMPSDATFFLVITSQRFRGKVVGSHLCVTRVTFFLEIMIEVLHLMPLGPSKSVAYQLVDKQLGPSYEYYCHRLIKVCNSRYIFVTKR